MRLIKTTTLELEEFPGLVPSYAILSHTWGKEEPHTPMGFFKILHASLRARSDDLSYLWVDTCCIDKTSSAELSEAINSMYGWYRNSTVCYAYLSDVPPLSPSGAAPHVISSSPFRRSRWFKRGWTLQELLAPKNLTFFSSDWSEISTKQLVAPLLQEITGIHATYLLRTKHITSASVAERMSWVSDRTTTRPEDVAYCLLGVFDVHMPLIYGEGARAFVRLQEEIIKISEDHSIFAWTTLWADPLRCTLLAPDPICFHTSGDYGVMSPSAKGEDGGGESVKPFVMTNVGLTVHLKLIRHVEETWYSP
ncbi:heterokaryon incompatibility protein-domain-containing protein [Coniochaeta sp. 2T2.1]|nr:heterokaryon incompatibility protein-domain-containing protein [Coniochaeta sp. 2T2.1]